MAGVVLLVGIASVAAQPNGPSATRSFDTASVAPGGRVTVTIQVADYGGIGRVTETLPAGFAYVSSTHDSAGVSVNGQEVRFTLQGDSSVAYTVTASRTAGSHSFSSMLRDSDRIDHTVGGATRVTVRQPSSGGGGGGGGGVSNRAPVFREGGTAARSVAENAAARASVGSPVTASDNDGDSITYSLAGDDASLFAIDTRTGQISVAQGTALDFETRSSYSVSARANDGRNGQDTIAVTNVEEAGTVSLSSANPEVRVTLTAMLEDPDGGVSDVGWSWERSMNLTTWMAIPGSGSAAYTPTEADEGYHLRATAVYSDDHGPNKRAHMVSANLVPVAPEPTPEPTVGPEHDDGGFPIWAIVLLVVGIPALIGGGLYLQRRLRA